MPLSELNQLELQFLLLNDFRLVISSDEMQRYAEQLILFSRSSGVLAGEPHAPHPLRNVTTASGNGVAAPISAMGVIDGSKFVDGRPSALTKHSTSGSHPRPPPLASRYHQNSSIADEDETETETLTEDSSSVVTTDDEPTIRASSVVSRDSDMITPNISSGQAVLDGKKTPEER